ncbi:MAG: hypothetical protein RIT45_2745 [Pseudomonadota bacterium]|jgi:hypothetical protein
MADSVLQPETPPSQTNGHFVVREDGTIDISFVAPGEQLRVSATLIGLMLLASGGCNALMYEGSWWLAMVGLVLFAAGMVAGGHADARYRFQPSTGSILRIAGAQQTTIATFADVVCVTLGSRLRVRVNGVTSKFALTRTLAIVLRDGRVVWLGPEHYAAKAHDQLESEANTLATTIGAQIWTAPPERLLQSGNGPIQKPDEVRYRDIGEAKAKTFALAFALLGLFVLAMLIAASLGLLARVSGPDS